MAAPSARRTLAIDVLSDVVCPWCYIGKRRLEAALAILEATHPELRPVVSWHPFELNPHLPREGTDRRAHGEAKFGGRDRLSAAHARVASAGAPLSIDFRFDAIARQPNTFDAHRLIAWTQARCDAAPLVEALFRAFFVEGRDIGDRGELARIAGGAGLIADAAASMLDSNDLADRVAATEERARALGVSAVPLFIFDGQVAVSGAHEPQTLLAAIGQTVDARTQPPSDAPV